MAEIRYEDEKLKLFYEDGILFCEFLSEIADFELIDSGVKKRLEITGTKKTVMVSDIRRFRSSTREARQRMSAKDAAEGIVAVGIIMNSKVQQVMYNFFNAIYKQPAPAKVFTTKEDAVEWIKQFIPKLNE